MKKALSLVLAVMMLASLCVCAFAEPVVKPAVTPTPVLTNTEKQLNLIFANLSSLSQDTDQEKWNYAITDLDHNGCLELVAVVVRGPEHYTYAKVWEVSPDLSSFVECDMSVKDDDPFVDIFQDSADTYYNKTTDTWYYMFSEDYAKNNEEFYAIKCSVSLKDGYVTPEAYAYEHCTFINGIKAIEYTDMQGNIITPDEYNAAGTNKFTGCDQSGTNFGWFVLADAKTVATLTDSYAYFTGEKTPAVVKDPAPKQTEEPINPGFLMIYKNPTSENRKEGDTTWFVAKAYNADSMVWTFVSPSGGEYTAQKFEYNFVNCRVSGANSTSLCIENVSTAMSGWGAYCTFYGKGQTARSSTAYLSVSSKPSPVYNSTSGTYSSAGSDEFAVGIYVPSVRTTIYVSPSIVNFDGDPYNGCSCTVYYTGNTPTGGSGGSVYAVTVYGSHFVGPAGAGWTCEICGTRNTTDRYYCSNCGQPQGAQPYGPGGTGWTCENCGIRNTDDHDYCSGCGQYRYDEPIVGPVGAGWTCDVCGTRNTEYDDHCSNCDHYRYEEPVGPLSNQWQCTNCGHWNDEYEVYCSSCGMSHSGTSWLGDLDATYEEDFVESYEEPQE